MLEWEYAHLLDGVQNDRRDGAWLGLTELQRV